MAAGLRIRRFATKRGGSVSPFGRAAVQVAGARSRGAGDCGREPGQL